MTRITRRTHRIAGAFVLAAGITVTGALSSQALIAPGTPARDVHVGGDEDNADNPFIQPPGVTAKLHMDNTDVLFGRGNDDLLIGKLGGDTLLGGGGSDILVGGPEAGSSGNNSDVLIGDGGNDVNIWAPGDGSDAFLGQGGADDDMIFAPFVTNTNGSLAFRWFHGRKIPKVTIDALPQFSCTIVKVPAHLELGYQFLVRFNVNGNPVVSVRQKDVETVYCPSPDAGFVLEADLTKKQPSFAPEPLDEVPGVTGAIMAPVK